MIELKPEVLELKDKIMAWEYRAGESFVDYFCGHPALFKPVSFGFWLLGKGYNDAHALWILDDIENNKSEDLMEYFDIYEYDSDSDVGYEKNMLILAEFLCTTEAYRTRVKKFFDEYENS